MRVRRVLDVRRVGGEDDAHQPQDDGNHGQELDGALAGLKQALATKPADAVLLKAADTDIWLHPGLKLQGCTSEKKARYLQRHHL